jgi:hypothetical protein
MGFMVKGWLRDKDEKQACHEGYQKRLETHQENREDTEVKGDFAQADRFFNQRL